MGIYRNLLLVSAIFFISSTIWGQDRTDNLTKSQWRMVRINNLKLAIDDLYLLINSPVCPADANTTIGRYIVNARVYEALAAEAPVEAYYPGASKIITELSHLPPNNGTDYV